MRTYTDALRDYQRDRKPEDGQTLLRLIDNIEGSASFWARRYGVNTDDAVTWIRTHYSTEEPPRERPAITTNWSVSSGLTTTVECVHWWWNDLADLYDEMKKEVEAINRLTK